MQGSPIIWFVMLLVAIVVSTFLHEVAHGISAYIAGFPVSTGFNRVGDARRRRGDPDFRQESAGYVNPWDMGPAVTLLLLVVFTVLLYRSERTAALWIFGALATANAFLRLVPVVMTYLSLLTGGTFVVEDEIGTGILWYELTAVTLVKYVPSLVSLLVSGICLYYIFSFLGERSAGLYRTRGHLYATILALVVSMPPGGTFPGLLNFLDERFRMDWIP